MTVLGFFVAQMSAADFFGLVIAAAICVYLLYALVRGERF
ncbi:MAG TPA: potassium-transporting ATPase subunit F [Solirubrobacteraceae bacterium]|jgi:K+-transporting ATPase KdpF subunit|nr:potassium-transporting ATPase subunit F [Solirubrobacteraceae bacterium]